MPTAAVLRWTASRGNRASLQQQLKRVGKRAKFNWCAPTPRVRDRTYKVKQARLHLRVQGAAVLAAGSGQLPDSGPGEGRIVGGENNGVKILDVAGLRLQLPQLAVAAASHGSDLCVGPHVRIDHLRRMLGLEVLFK